MASFSLKKTSHDFFDYLRPYFTSKRFTNSKKSLKKEDAIEKDAFYSAQNLESCPWPQTEEGRYAEAFLTPLIKNGVLEYIENVQTNLFAFVRDGIVFPVTVNQAEYGNSYVCSPYSFFISYARESLDFIPQNWIRKSIQILLDTLGKGMQLLQLNKAAVVNNWFFSTNLYPSLQKKQLMDVVDTLQGAFPDHAIVFRCIDPFINPVCYQTLRQKGFEYIATRQIYFLDTQDTSFFSSRLFKSDLKLLTNSGYEIIDGEQITEDEIPRLLELYRNLYLQKYSCLNPNFSEKYIRLVLKQNLMRFKALKKEGRIDGIVGYVEREGKMYCPFFGYDTTLPQESGLYRILSTVLMLEARERKLFFHQSSGASMYKTIRKAQSSIEYTAVYYNHLKIHRRWPWIILKNLYNTAGIIFMKRY